MLADRLAAMGLQRAAARQVGRALVELEEQGGEPLVRDQLRRWLACWPADAGHDYDTIQQQGFPVRVFEQGGEPVIVTT
jgi:hypothetical protein